MTPMALPTVALPTARIPDEDKIMPAGRVAPLAETPKTPPLVTPVGSVVAKSKLLLVPAGNDGRVKFHAEGGVGDGGGAGGDGDGDGPGGGGVGASATSFSSDPPQPNNANSPVVAAADLRNLLRSIFVIAR